jgi:hypothetical protein
MSKSAVENARQKWAEACNLWVYLLCEQWGLDGRRGYWIGDEVGGVWDMDGVVILSMDEIIYAVEHHVADVGSYHDWRDYCMDLSELNIGMPSFIEWCKGIKVMDEESLDRLLKMKHDLDKLVEEEKKKLKQE